MSDIQFHTLAPNRARSGQDPLLAFLVSAKGGAVTLCARDTPRIDSYRLQILLAAQQQWHIDNVPFSLIDMAPSFCAGLERLGLSPNHFDMEPQQ